VSRRIVIAYWLIPTEPARSYFQSIVNDLAERYAAPEFEPHVTVHVGMDCTETVDEVLSKAGRSSKKIALQVLNVSSSSEFIKTLFVHFTRSTQLQQLNQGIRTAAQDSSDYQLNPHLSLLYKKMSILARRQLDVRGVGRRTRLDAGREPCLACACFQPLSRSQAAVDRGDRRAHYIRRGYARVGPLPIR